MIVSVFFEKNFTIFAPMPTISMFQGILIRMYLGKKEHNPPHIHAYFQKSKAIYRS